MDWNAHNERMRQIEARKKIPQLVKEWKYVRSEIAGLLNGEKRKMGGCWYTAEEFLDEMLDHLVHQVSIAMYKQSTTPKRGKGAGSELLR